MSNYITSYNGNPLLKPPGALEEFGPNEIQEYIKCSKDPIYFIRNYVKIVHVDRGIIPFDLYDCQDKYINHIHINRRSILMAARQVGKTTLSVAYLLWFILFNDNKNCAILANKQKTATMILDRIKKAYELLPKWLQQGIVEWNKTSIALENGSNIVSSATSGSAARGSSISLLFIDELAFVPNSIAEEFWTSVYPTISSGEETKVILSSTPRGFNMFWRMWDEAERGLNGFAPFTIKWNEVPGRDEKWLEEQKRVLGPVKTAQEIFCSFVGSSNTLVESGFIENLQNSNPISQESKNLKIFKEPEKDHSYISIVDTARGEGQDYSVDMIIDVTQQPYEVVAVFRDNQINAYAFPSIVHTISTKYNEAFCLIENNDAGSTVAEILYRDFEYVNMFMTGAKEKLDSASYKRTPGIKTTRKVKVMGCSALKAIIENNKIIINDADTISEFSTFIAKNGSYAAESGYHDDLVMCLVLFGYLTQQPIFKELMDIDSRTTLFDKQIAEAEETLAPISCFVVTGEEENQLNFSGMGKSPEYDWLFTQQIYPINWLN